MAWWSNWKRGAALELNGHGLAFDRGSLRALELQPGVAAGRAFSVAIRIPDGVKVIELELCAGLRLQREA
jgi:hypothetical protein